MDYKRIALYKIAEAQSYLQDFGGGVDPFGLYTSSYGAQGARAGLTDEEHALRRRIGTAGGLIGGATVVPAAISGLIGGFQGLAGGKGIGGRLAGFGTGFARGAQRPFKAIYQGSKGSKALRSIESGQKSFKDLSKAEKANLQSIIRESQVGTLERAGKANQDLIGRLSPQGQAALASGNPAMMEALPAADQALIAGALRKPLSSGLNEAKSQLALGGLIGGIGANVQYRKGKEQGEREVALMQGIKQASVWDLATKIAMEKIAMNLGQAHRLGGAALGGLGGGVAGAIAGGEDNRIQGALLGAGLGAAGGALGGHLATRAGEKVHKGIGQVDALTAGIGASEKQLAALEAIQKAKLETYGPMAAGIGLGGGAAYLSGQ